MLCKEDILGAIEAILFVRTEPAGAEEIAGIVGISSEEALEALQELETRYENLNSGLQIVKHSKGYSMCTRPVYHEYVHRANLPQAAKLSQAAMETLAIIAYRQPLTRPEIEAVRGVRVDRTLQSLMKRDLIYEVGRREVAGRPLVYATTNEFLKLFGLTSLDELPHIEEGENEQIT